MRLNRPDARNALNLLMKDELAAALLDVTEDDSVRAVVLTGAGPGFCSGADFRDLSPETGSAYRRELSRLQAALITRIREAPQAFVAAVNGAAVGGGFALAAVCDVLIASDTAWFSAPNTRLGIAADLGLAALLPTRIGAGRTRALLLTGARLTAAEAAAQGLVYEVTAPADLLPRATAIARAIAATPATGIAATKRLLDAGLEVGWQDFLDLEARELALLRLTPEHAAAVSAAARRG